MSISRFRLQIWTGRACFLLKGNENFRGLRYEPSYEGEVVFLFGLLIPYFEDKFVVDCFSGSFPDCFMLRNGKQVGVEFEVLASDFYAHKHDRDPNLSKCQLIICWKNNLPQKTVEVSDKRFLKVVFKGQEHLIEVMALNEVVERFEKEKSLKFILAGRRPDLDKADEKHFFSQLQGNAKTKYGLVLELYDFLKRKEEFEVKCSHGKRWFTLNFHVKRWDVAPIRIQGDGLIWIVYEENPAISPWQLPAETQEKIRPLLGHDKPKRKSGKPPKWPAYHLKNQEDLNKLKKVIEILAEDSKKYPLSWR